MNDILFAAFHDELEKMAVSARWLGSKLGTAPRLRDTSWDLGKGALGARQELYKQLKLQPGWSQVQARQVRERTQAQMQRIDDLFADKANRMKQKAPRVNANPKSIERGRAFAKDMDIIGEIRSNVLDPPTIRRAFETMPD
jgi:hypothetical protein